MKRLLTLIIAIIYFCISSGFVMSVHYCMGKVSKATIEIASSKSCVCGKKEMKGCCKTESKFIKLSDNYQATYADVSIVSPFYIVPNFYTISNTIVVNSNIKLAFNNHSPPIVSPQPIYILNCVFRI
ncbi:MAG: hypothetical protein H7068_07975 [Pedobacter sp.]|nr:hypothetical protein [Chitinophagaceae bacterium]